MLKFQIILIAILICCMAFMSCSRTQDALEDVMMDPEPEMNMIPAAEVYRTWMSVTLPAPMMSVDDAKAAMNAAGTGQAHGTGARTVYFNEAAAMANMAEGDKMYPVGSMIVKDVMNDDNTMVVHVASMIKTDDMMFMDHGGWIYGVDGNNFAAADAAGCDSCHTAAGEGNDYVFVSLKMDEEMMDDMTGDGDTDMTGDGDTDMTGDGDTGMTGDSDTGMTDDGDTNGNGNGGTNGSA